MVNEEGIPYGIIDTGWPRSDARAGYVTLTVKDRIQGQEGIYGLNGSIMANDGP